MLTPKEKAKELVEKMHIESDIIYVMSKSQAKKCAIKLVDEILNYINIMNKDFNLNLSSNYWKKVKEEIEKGY